MMWAPNVGTGYPYGYAPGLVSLTDFAILDTNKDGVIDGNDDPYGPYYPGSEHVDWVGLSAYWYDFLKSLQSGTRMPIKFQCKDTLVKV